MEWAPSSLRAGFHAPPPVVNPRAVLQVRSKSTPAADLKAALELMSGPVILYAGTRDQTETLAKVINDLKLGDRFDPSSTSALDAAAAVYAPALPPAAGSPALGGVDQPQKAALPWLSTRAGAGESVAGGSNSTPPPARTAAAAARAASASRASRVVRAAPYHAGLTPAERLRVHTDFQMDRLRVVCAVRHRGVASDDLRPAHRGWVVVCVRRDATPAHFFDARARRR